MRPRVALGPEVAYLPRGAAGGAGAVYLAPGAGIVNAHAAKVVIGYVVAGTHEVGRRGDVRSEPRLGRLRILLLQRGKAHLLQVLLP